MQTRRQERATLQLTKNQTAVNEEVRALTTGALDALHHAPTNPPTDLARTFLRRDQQLVGLPQQRIDVEALLNSNKVAWTALSNRFAMQDELIVERAKLQDKLAEANARLVEMGKELDAERSKSIWRRIWHWTVGTLGLGGVVALVILCQAVLPVLGSLLGWLLSKVPSLVSLFGLVGKRAFDATVVGVGNLRKALKVQAALPPESQPKYSAADVQRMLDSHLKESLEVGAADYKPLIDSRRKALNV